MGITDISVLKPDNEEVHVIGLVTGRPPSASCTCGWSVPPSAELIALAQAAVQHSADTGHVLRKHDPIE